MYLTSKPKQPMLDQLVKLVEQNAGKAIVQNDAIPNKFNNEAIQEVIIAFNKCFVEYLVVF